jgi:hypothetical protein
MKANRLKWFLLFLLVSAVFQLPVQQSEADRKLLADIRRKAEKGDADKHPVCAAILGFVNAGKRGIEIRRSFSSGQYGWPQDAIDGALVLLSVTGHLRATQNASRSTHASSTTPRSAFATSAPSK